MPGSPDPVQRARDDAAAGRLQPAIDSLRRVVARDPRHAAAHTALAELLQRAGHSEQAVYFAQRSAELAPASADALNTLGYVLMTAGRAPAALHALERAVAVDPVHLRALSNLCGLLRSIGRLDDAVRTMRRMLAAHPGNEFAYADVNVLLQVGMAREAAGILRRAAKEFPRAVWLKRDLCIALNYTDDADEGEIVRSHRDLGALLPPPAAMDPRNPDPDRQLRVALISPDFREHSVAYFLRPLLDLGRRGLLPVCYHCSAKSDATTDRVRARAIASGGEWHDAGGLDNAALARRLRRDDNDIVIDLAGWTAGSRLFALAARVAPVQISYLGYPNTTGVPAIDARIVDHVTDPPGSEALATEHLVHLDRCFLSYEPPETGVAGESAPEAERGSRPVTFGSFNSIRKITPSAVQIWASLLRQVPDSRMIIKSVGLDSALARDHLLGLFEREAIGAARIELLNRVESRAEHFALYSRIDVALDTYPYHGATTTCEAVWMGTPVVSLTGPGHRSRVGVSLLTAAGLPELAAADPETFCHTAGRLVRDGSGLQSLRRGLRDAVFRSALCDHTAAADAIAAAVRRLWRSRCNRQSQ